MSPSAIDGRIFTFPLTAIKAPRRIKRIKLYSADDKDDKKNKEDKKKKKTKDQGTDSKEDRGEIERSIDDIFSIILHGPFTTPRKPFDWHKRRKEEEEKDYFEIDKEVGEDEDIDLDVPEIPEEFIEDIDMNKLKTLDGLMETAEKYKDKNNKDMKILVSLLGEMKELNTMIGMNDIKNIVASQIVFLTQKFSKDDMMHTVIQGPPGCGKQHSQRY